MGAMVDRDWVHGLARKACSSEMVSTVSVHKVTHDFLNELAEGIDSYTHYFNELVHQKRPDAVCMSFRLSPPRHGIMLLRGKDKLVVSLEQNRVRARVISNHSFAEVTAAQYDFELVPNEMGTMHWVCLQDGYKVSSELIIKNYLSLFLIDGAKAFSSNDL